MGITVKEALQIGELKKAKVIAGEKGLHRIMMLPSGSEEMNFCLQRRMFL